MRKVIKQFTSLFLIPLTRWYLRKERTYSYLGTTVTVLPGVFHPGLFYSTKFLIDYLQDQPVTSKSLLELGCGTGLISVIAAKSGAVVTATDLSRKAIDNINLNANRNGVNIRIIQSDLFNSIERETFDWIIINPPYYAGTASSEEELAWYAGENFDYFRRLFKSLSDYSHKTTEIIMVLTKGSEVSKISTIGNESGFAFELIKEKNVFFDEKDFLYRIRRLNG
jgi:release factor glutamine methyltransferase